MDAEETRINGWRFSPKNLVIVARVEYAAFTLKAADLAGLAPGDRLLLPEIGTEAPRWVTEMPDDDLVHVSGSNLQFRKIQTPPLL